MTGPPTNATVLNTTVLSNFAQVDRVELLLDLPRLVTVDAVQEELEAGTDRVVRDYFRHRVPISAVSRAETPNARLYSGKESRTTL